MQDCTGQKFGRLKVLKQWLKQVKTQRVSYVLSQCDCGKLKEYYLFSLKSGHTRSCGCFNKELNTTHGMKGSAVYDTWSHMIQRCTNSKNRAYKDYGGRGIKICDRWLKFENFYQDMGDKPEGLQLDRIDNNKSYFKENCRWTTIRKNNQNQRTSKYWFLYGKKYESSTEAAESLRVCPETIRNWCDGYSWVSKTGTRYEYPPKPGCYSQLKY